VENGFINDSGKHTSPVSLVNTALKSGIFASNIPMREKEGKIWERVLCGSSQWLVETLIKNLDEPHILMAIDEPESVFQNLLKITHERKTLVYFSIWSGNTTSASFTIEQKLFRWWV